MKVKYKGKEYNIPKHYLANLKGKERTAQIKSIVEKKERPKTSFVSKRSGWAKKFEDKYKTKITDKEFIHKNILRKAGQEQVINKGKGAYYSSGSRPNQTPFSWGYGRLASVILGGPSRKIDRAIWEKYKR
tara:strand:- start:4276 stop:4668 length:393 start_codon:yes stop_codon:yes gene_type:complete